MIRKYTVHPSIRINIEDLVTPPIIIRVSDFNEKGSKEFAIDLDKANNTGQPFVPIVIDSYGGEVYSLLEMITSIQHSALPIFTILEGKAMSAGALLFAMGHRRFMAKNATLMFHDVSNGFWGKAEEVKTAAKETERLNRLLYSLIAKNVGKPDRYFTDILHKLGHAEWHLTAKEGKKHNLVTTIGIPVFSINVNVSYDLT